MQVKELIKQGALKYVNKKRKLMIELSKEELRRDESEKTW